MMKLKNRVETLESCVMPTLEEFFTDLKKVDPEFCATVIEFLRRDVESPDQKVTNPSKKQQAAFLNRTLSIIHEQSDPETALPLTKFRDRMATSVATLA